MGENSITILASQMNGYEETIIDPRAIGRKMQVMHHTGKQS